MYSSSVFLYECNLTVMADSEENIEYDLNILNETSNKINLVINTRKTKIYNSDERE